MNSSTFEDLKVNVKMKLSALWITLMFCYSYADVLGFYSPGNLAEILTGEIGGVPLTQEMLLAMESIMGHGVTNARAAAGEIRAQQFTWDQTAIKTLQVYENLIGQ